MNFKFDLLISVFGFLSILFQGANVHALQEQAIVGEWIAISKSGETSILPVVGQSFLLGRDFLAEEESLKLSTGEEKQLLLYDAVWRQDQGTDHYQKWYAVLYCNPDPTSSLRSRSKEAIAGYATCWINGDSGVIVFSQVDLELEVLDFTKLKVQSPEYRVFSICRRAAENRDRATLADEFLKQFGTLDGPTKRLHGGWASDSGVTEKNRNSKNDR